MSVADNPQPSLPGAAKLVLNKATLVTKAELPEWAELQCRVGPGGVEVGDLFQNDVFVEEEQSIFENQTSSTVEKLESAVSYRCAVLNQGKGASKVRMMDLRGLRHLLLNFVLVSQFLLLQPLVSASGSKAGNAAELFERVSHSVKMKHYGEALDDLNAAIEADPKFSEAYFHRASILRQQCRYKESEVSYKKFLELKPHDSGAEKELSQLHQAQSALDTALTLFESGDYAKSLEYISKVVLVFSPACSKAKILKVRLLIATKDYSGAISESGYILKEDEDNLEALLLRGRAYYYLADHDVAIRHYQKGLRLDPEHSELKKAYFGLKNLLKKTKSADDNVNKGKLRVGVEDFKAALAMDPDHLMHNVHLHLGLCKVLVKLGRGKEALASCNEALSIDEELLDALVQRGEAKLLTEDWEGAVEDLKSAAQKSSQDMNIREALMRAEKALKLSKRKDWYKILGVSKTSTVAEIKRAYKKLALQWHPDKNVDNSEEAEVQFREIAAAYEVLGDEEKRTRYDRGEDLEDMGMGGGGGGGFNPFGGGGGQEYTFSFEGGFPGGGFGGGFPGGGGGGFDFHF